MESVQNDNGKFKPKRFDGKSKKSVPKLNFLIDQKKHSLYPLWNLSNNNLKIANAISPHWLVISKSMNKSGKYSSIKIVFEN